MENSTSTEQKNENLESSKIPQNPSSKYELLEQIGSGTYGCVFKSLHRETGQIVAVKQMDMSDESERREGLGVTTLREIALLKRLKHPNVVELLDVEYDGQTDLKLIFEYCENGDLHKYMWAKQQNFSKQEAKRMIKQVIEVTAYCHAHRAFHRDLKPHNLLIDKNGDIKIADFGLARAFSRQKQNYTHEVVTLWYRAPEILLGQNDYSLGVDIWSIGCIFAEMLMHGRVLFGGTSEIEQLFKIFSCLGTPSEENWCEGTSLKDFKNVFPQWPQQKDPFSQLMSSFFASGTVDPRILDLLQKMVALDPEKRLCCREVLEHPYFNSFKQ